MPIEVETERLLLKIPGDSAAPAVLDFYSRNRLFLNEWEPERTPDFYTLLFQEEQLEQELAAYQRQSGVRFWLYKKENPDAAIGSVAAVPPCRRKARLLQ